MPDRQDRFLQEPYVARRRLQTFELVDEQPFEPRFCDVHGAAGWTAVIVGVPTAVAAFGPAAGQSPVAHRTPNETSEWKIRPASLTRRRWLNTSGQHRLDAIENVLAEERFEVATLPADAVVRNVDDADVQRVLQQRAECLRAQWEPFARRESAPPDLRE